MEKNDFDYIIGEITFGLTGDPEVDIPYLREQANEYKDSKYGKEIARACGRLIYSMIPEEQKKDISKLSENYLLGVSSIIEEASFNMYQKKFDVARDMLSSIVEKLEKLDMYQDDAVSEYHTFNSLIEELIYANIHNPTKEIRRAAEPYSTLYLNLGVVLVELGELDAAKIALEKATRWNPIDPNISFEYAEIFKMQGDLDEFLRLTTEAYSHTYQSQHLARCYRNFGYYFIEKGLWQLAASCYLYSTRHDSDIKHAQSELWYIQQKAGPSFTMPTDADLLETFSEYKIPLGANRNIINLLVELANEAKSSGHIEYAKYFLETLYDLTGYRDVKEMLDELASQITDPPTESF